MNEFGWHLNLPAGHEEELEERDELVLELIELDELEENCELIVVEVLEPGGGGGGALDPGGGVEELFGIDDEEGIHEGFPTVTQTPAGEQIHCCGQTLSHTCGVGPTTRPWHSPSLSQH